MAKKKAKEVVVEEVVTESVEEALPKVSEAKAELESSLVTVPGEHGKSHTGLKTMMAGREHLRCSASDGSTYLVHLDEEKGVWIV